MMEYFYLYRIYENGDATILGRFPSLSQAKLSATLLLIKELCFILTGDMNKIYFYDEKNGWDYDIMTQKGKIEFLDIYQNPRDYK